MATYRELDTYLQYEQPTKYIVNTEDYSDEYSTPVLTAGKTFILGYTNEIEGIFQASQEPVIIFDDFTSSIQYVNFDFKVKSSAMKILHKINGEDNLKYLFYAMKCLEFTPFSHKRLWISEYSKLKIQHRSSQEQNKIASELNNIEQGIKVKQEQLKALDELIQSRFTEMFGQRLLSARMLLSEIATFTIGLTYKPENVSEKGTIVLRSGNIQNNELALNDDIVRVANIKIPTEKFVKNQDILMCSRNGSAKLVGKSCLICNPTEQMAFGAFMTVIRTSYPYFLQSFFTSQFFKSQLTDVSTASVKQITSKMLKNYLVIKPRAEEERQFAEFVQKVERAKEIVKIQIKDLQELLALKMDEYFK